MSEREYAYFLKMDKKCKEYGLNNSESKFRINNKSKSSLASASKSEIPFEIMGRANVDFLGNFTLHFLLDESKEKVSAGGTFGIDVIPFKSKWLNIGIGYEFQLKRELEESSGKFGFNSYYLVLQAPFKESIYFGRFGTGSFKGDNTFTGNGFFDLSHSGYVNFGWLMKLDNNLFVELASTYFQGDIYYGVDDWMWCEYTNTNIGLGYYLN